ncbi:MAG TPA: prolyl oligopeptidase family serine peptidase [Bryobacteraceae bacterium]|nr:prolyl oligopeptidase family serine peptidase [Bryobacteraceae bacterium]
MLAKTVLSLAAAAFLVHAAESYQKPPKAILDVMDAPVTPTLLVSPTGNFALESRTIPYPPIAELAEPMLRIAGIRINPKTNGLHNVVFLTDLSLRKIPSGAEVKLQLPAGARVLGPKWAGDGAHFAFTITTASGMELWAGDTSGRVHKIEGVSVNGVMGAQNSVQWMPDNKTLLVQTVRTSRGAAPREPVPTGPHVQESLGGGAPAPTLEDMLASPHDEDLFVYYATSQLALVDTASGKVTPAGRAGIIASAEISPNGKYLLVSTIHKPFSYLHAYRSFPREVEVWDVTGKMLHKVASVPLEDKVPINGVPTGPRNIEWRTSDAATLIWVEALDGGDLRHAAPFRDKIVTLKAPFTGEPHEVFKTQQRFAGIRMGAKGGFALVTDTERKTRRVRTFEIDLDKPDQAPKLIWSRNNQDRYADPGQPLSRTMPNGSAAIIQDGDSVFLAGLGSSPTGDHPFLNRYHLASGQTEPMFKCDNDHYETVVDLLDDHGAKFLTRRESPTEPPNYFARTPNGAPVAVTEYPDPQPSIRGIHKELVKYKREDGVELSFTLYLPADYKPGTRLPTVVWAYPYEYNDAATASQVSGSTKRFTEMRGYSELLFALDGYAVLANTAMPIVGSDPDTVNNTFVDQVVMDAKAAIDKAVEMGVTDRNRVGVGGHSYGGFMTDTLMAHCDLFRAGISESGAPNRTLTPFGFQSERRTLWQAPEVYLKMSPFMYADKIKAPILFIHGEADDNSGTFPIQSERMYEAVRGNGGITRLVFLPFEAHGYRGKETIEHVVWEKLTWFDKYVKAAGPAEHTSANEAVH